MLGGKQIFLDKSITKNKSEILLMSYLRNLQEKLSHLEVFYFIRISVFSDINDLFNNFNGVYYYQFI